MKSNVFREGGVHVMAERCETCIFRPPARVTTPCVEWTGATSNGYGVRRIDGRNYRVHRLAWEEENGPIPEGAIVMHLCDNPPCYRLDHLMLGTHQDNSDDKWAKGRGNAPRGEAAGRARLTEGQVWDVLARIEAGESQRAIARSLGVSPGTVFHIASRRNWRHLLPLGNLMSLQPGRVQRMVRACQRTPGGNIPCHKTLDLPGQAICRGFWDGPGQADGLLKLARALRVVVFDGGGDDE